MHRFHWSPLGRGHGDDVRPWFDSYVVLSLVAVQLLANVASLWPRRAGKWTTGDAGATDGQGASAATGRRRRASSGLRREVQRALSSRALLDGFFVSVVLSALSAGYKHLRDDIAALDWAAPADAAGCLDSVAHVSHALSHVSDLSTGLSVLVLLRLVWLLRRPPTLRAWVAGVLLVVTTRGLGLLAIVLCLAWKMRREVRASASGDVHFTLLKGVVDETDGIIAVNGVPVGNAVAVEAVRVQPAAV